jgi:transposase
VKEAKISKRAPVLLVVVGATAHNLRSKEIPEGLEILKLPPYSPDLQPIERIWKIVNQNISNRCNANWDVMVERILERCKWMMEYGVDLVRRFFFIWRCWFSIGSKNSIAVGVGDTILM